jgi:hypothetical protein
MSRLNISVIVEKDGRRESGSAGAGGREGYDRLMSPEQWKKMAAEALRQALVNLEARDAPGGAMEVALGAGWPGILLHEAIGHGLEGDFNRKGTSAFTELMGKRIASPGVTVIDDGTIPGRRGSLSIDDEGTPTNRTVLIEDGILTGYMQDRQNARLMGVAPTGNGRRQSYAHIPMPRMTNTIMLNGEADPAEILHRGLPGEKRQDPAPGEGRHPDRRRPLGPATHPRRRQRYGNGPRHRHLRQERPGRAGGRRPADPADRGADGGGCGSSLTQTSQCLPSGPKRLQLRTSVYFFVVPCVDVYGPRLIATVWLDLVWRSRLLTYIRLL